MTKAEAQAELDALTASDEAKPPYPCGSAWCSRVLLRGLELIQFIYSGVIPKYTAAYDWRRA